MKGLDLRDRVPDELWTEVHDHTFREGENEQPHLISDLRRKASNILILSVMLAEVLCHMWHLLC